MGRKLNLLASTAVTTSTALLSGGALAADIAVKARPPAAFSWTGCYAGVSGGLISGTIDQRLSIPAPVNLAFNLGGKDKGGIFGGQVGCNYQPNPQNWFVGIEADLSHTSLSRSGAFAFVFSGEDTVGSQRTRLRWLGTVRGRLGVVWNQRTLVFGTGGLAIGRIDSSVSATVTTGGGVLQYLGSHSSKETGWVAGGGIEHAFANNISGKIEVLHFDLGDVTYNVNRVSGASFIPATWAARAGVKGNIVRAGLNIRLNPP